MKKFFTLAILLALVISGIQCSVYETLTNLSQAYNLKSVM